MQSCGLRCKGSDAFKGLLRAFLVSFKTITFVLMARLNRNSISAAYTFAFEIPATTGASTSKKKASSNGEGTWALQIYHVFVANHFHCHPCTWPFHCG